MKKQYRTGYSRWNGTLKEYPNAIPPANDNWNPNEAWKPRKPAKSTRKEYARSADGPEELDDGYFASLLACDGSGLIK